MVIAMTAGQLDMSGDKEGIEKKTKACTRPIVCKDHVVDHPSTLGIPRYADWSITPAFKEVLSEEVAAKEAKRKEELKKLKKLKQSRKSKRTTKGKKDTKGGSGKKSKAPPKKKQKKSKQSASRAPTPSSHIMTTRSRKKSSQ